MSGWADRLLERWIPPGGDPELRRRSRLLAAFVPVLDVVVLIAAPVDGSSGYPITAAAEIVGAVTATATLQLLRRGHVQLTAQLITGIVTVTIAVMGWGKGGLPAVEIAWQCVSIVFAVLVLGSRGALPWTVVAGVALIGHAALFDAGWVPPNLDLADPPTYTFQMAMLYTTVWCLAAVFDHARADSHRRLEVRNDAMRRVLDHVSDGLLTIDRDGRVSAERSAITERWLGPIHDGDALWDVIGRAAPDAADWLRVGWEAVVDDLLPRELTLGQLPNRLVIDGRTLTLTFTAIDGPTGIAGALLVVHDVTAEIAGAQVEAGRRDLANVLDQVRADPGAVANFVSEVDRLVASVVGSSEPAVAVRDLHTIKGTCGLFGVHTLAALCHTIEDHLAERGGSPNAEEREALARGWGELAGTLRDWTGADAVRIRRADLAEIEDAIHAEAPRAVLAGIVQGWDRLPLSRAFDQLARQGTALALRLGKDVTVVAEPTALRVDGARFGPVLSALVHVVRNAVDHGIEPTDQRGASGKPARGTIRLRAAASGGRTTIEVEDDGRGIDWERVRTEARARAMPAATDDELVDVLFADGFSTRGEVDLVSGRGVGLAAIRGAVRDTGGEVSVSSELGRGCVFKVAVPA